MKKVRQREKNFDIENFVRFRVKEMNLKFLLIEKCVISSILLQQFLLYGACDQFGLCIKRKYNDPNYNETKKDIMIGIYVDFTNFDSIFDFERYLKYDLYYRKPAEETLNMNLNILLYTYSQSCDNRTTELFLDILLNSSLNDRKSFKIVSIIAFLNSKELKQLANVMSPYSIPIIAYLIWDNSVIKHVQSIHDYYKNVLIIPVNYKGKTEFLIEFFKKTRTDILTILYNIEDNNQGEVYEMIRTFNQNSICVNTYNIKHLKKEKIYHKLETERKYSHTFLVINKEYDILETLLGALSDESYRKIMVIYNIHDDDGFYGGFRKMSFYDRVIDAKTDIISFFTVDLWPWRNQGNIIEGIMKWIVFFENTTEQMSVYWNSDQNSSKGDRNLPEKYLKDSILPYWNHSIVSKRFAPLYVFHISICLYMFIICLYMSFIFGKTMNH